MRRPPQHHEAVRFPADHALQEGKLMRPWLAGSFIAALAATGPALISTSRADECDALTSRIVTEVGGTVRTRIGPAVKLQHPAMENFSVDCRGPTISRVSGSRESPGSLAPMAQLMARTSRLALGTTEQAATTIMLQCIRAAANKAGLLAEAVGQGLKVECYVLRNYVAIDVQRTSP